ncbi:MAG: hypothetical protein KC643_33635 [Nitrospira sp.]|nr:hypothetical protein [Nitrospira sp.]MCA9498568.1 hypothetical protein [Nitrospira sp.]
MDCRNINLLAMIGLIVVLLSSNGGCIAPGASPYPTKVDLPKPNSISKSEKKPPDVFWNVWAEDRNGPRFEPITSLTPNTHYRLALDLAAIKYRAAGTLGMPTSQTFNNEVAKWLKPGMPSPILKILLLVDPGKFSTQRAMKDFEVNHKRIREVWKKGEINVDDDHFFLLQEAFEAGEEPEFKFGGIFFEVKTTDREGPAAIAFSIWYQDRPIDEVSVQLCIAGSQEAEIKKCGEMKNTIAAQGLASVRVATKNTVSPIAAVHFVALGPDEKVTGVFRESTWAKDRFLVWHLDQGAEKFRQTISDEFLQDIATGHTDDNLLIRGETLFSHLFPVGIKSHDGRNIQQEIRKFLQPYLMKDPIASDYLPPSIFVRMIQVSPSPSLPLPLGLLAIRMDLTQKMTMENGRFLGHYFLIESPLEIQTYGASKECLSRWVMVIPPEDTGDQAINNARNLLGPRINQWANQRALPFKKMTEFIEWVSQSPSDQEEDPPTTLLTLSHHDRNSLYFYKSNSPKDNPLRPSVINRKFAQPSVAIINGCGTGGDGAIELISRLNRQGFSTLIAASTEIEGMMAGSFLNLFADEISKYESEDPRTIGLTYWKTTQRLRSMKPEGVINAKPFGAHALKFSLLGDGSVTLCSPKKENRPLVEP